jgi:high affinity sulfate transporter 1
MVGLLCIAAGIARLGFIANFLSRPILVGYLNGIALSIIVGQVGKLLGIDVPGAGFFRTAGRIIQQLGQTHWPTMIVGLSLVALLLFLKFFVPKVPGPLVAAVLSIGLIYILRLDHQGVRVVGALPAGFPAPRIPVVALSDLGNLVAGACSIVLVSFCSMMTTAQGFAAKNGYTIRPNQDLMALGACDLVSGLSHGFVVSGADSRTAVADTTGGKTQVTSLAAAATMLVVLFFLTAPLAYMPSAALAAILITSALGLFDFASLVRYYRISKPEFRHSVIAMLGVMTIGVLPGVLVAVGVAFVKLLKITSRPHDAVLGRAPGKREFYNLAAEPAARPIPGMIIYRFEAPLLFFNAGYFQERVRALVHDAPEAPKWFVFDAESASLLDTTAADTLLALDQELAGRGIVLVIARAKGWCRKMLELSGVAEQIGDEYLFRTVEAAVEAYEARATVRE